MIAWQYKYASTGTGYFTKKRLIPYKIYAHNDADKYHQKNISFLFYFIVQDALETDFRRKVYAQYTQSAGDK
jgi:hypothetical protein